jgi:hypothetical protein
VLAAAVDDGDELAVAWERVRELGQQLDHLREIERSLRRELREARQELKAQEQRFGWLRGRNDDLRAALEREHRDGAKRISSLLGENRALRQRIDALLLATSGIAEATASTGQRPGNRAQRRRDARQTRRRS